MYSDVECPYCEVGQEINHKDGYGYEEDETHNQECKDCGKTFTFTTSISFSYDARKAHCLNGGEHKYTKTYTAPIKYTKMYCVDCGEKREPTEDEWKEIQNQEKGGEKQC